MSGPVQRWFNGLPIAAGGDGTTKYWFNGLPVLGASGDVSATLTGVAGTSGIGTVRGAIDNAVTGVSATGSPGTITLDINNVSGGALVGVVGSGEIGSFTREVDVLIIGAEVTGVAGTGVGNVSSTLGGASGTGSAGTETASASVAVTGVTATGSAGTVVRALDNNTNLTGVQASALTLPGATTFSSTDITGSDASVSSDHLTFMSGLTGAFGNRGVRAGSGKFTGLRYLEYTCTVFGGLSSFVGIRTLASSLTGVFGAFGAEDLGLNPNVYYDGVRTTSNVGDITNGDVVSLAINFPSKRGWIRVNAGNWNGSALADPATGVGGIDLSSVFTANAAYPTVKLTGNSMSVTLNAGGTSFVRSPPSGYSGWDTDTTTVYPSVSNFETGAVGTGAVGSIIQTVSTAEVGNAATTSVGSFAIVIADTLTGVVGTGSAGSFVTAGQTNVPLTGVTASGSVGTFEPTVNGILIGGAGTCTVGTFVSEITDTVSGVSATGTSGTFSLTVEKGLTGTAGTCAAGIFIPQVDIGISGVSAASGIGAITGSSALLVAVTGNAGSGFAGSFVPDVDKTLPGPAGTGTAGSLVPEIDIGVIAVIGTTGIGAVVGQVFSATNVDLVGVAANGLSGTVTVEVAGRAIGVSAVGSAGTVRGAADRVFAGVTASANTGTVVPNPAGVASGVSALGNAGTILIDVDDSLVLTGASATGSAGTAVGGVDKRFSGNQATGQLGLMRGGPGANLNSVTMFGSVGSLTFSYLANVPSVSAVLHVGSIIPTIPESLVGVVATGGVGTFTKEAYKTLTGVTATGRAQQFTNAFLRGNAATTGVGTFSKILVKNITGVQASAQLGQVLLNLVTPSKYYLTSASNFGSLVLNVIPPSAVHVTGWKVARDAGPEFSIMKYNTEQNTSTFHGVSQLTAAPTAITGNSWRTFGALTGTIQPGSWSMQAAVRAISSASGQSGRIRLRVWKSANSNGLTPTEITTGAQVGTTTGALSLVADQLSTVTFSTAAPITLTNEYIFFEVEWEIVGAAASNNQADVHFSLGANSFVVVPVTGITVAVPAVSAAGSAGVIRVAEAKTITGVSATGNAGFLAADRQAELSGVFAVCDHGVFGFRIDKVVPGVRATGSMGIAHSQVAVVGSISLISANGVGFAGDMATPGIIPLTGNVAPGAVGMIIPEADKALTGVSATGSAGTVTSAQQLSIFLGGTEAAASAGDVTGTFDITFDGVSAFAVSGTMSPDTRKLLTSVFGTGFAGVVTREPNVGVEVPGASANGQAGLFEFEPNVTIEGVQASAQAGELPQELNQLLESVEGDGQSGDLVPEVDFFWDGTSGTGFAGSLHPNSAIMNGAGAVGDAGVIIGAGRSRGTSDRLLPRLVNGRILWFDNTPTQ